MVAPFKGSGGREPTMTTVNVLKPMTSKTRLDNLSLLLFTAREYLKKGGGVGREYENLREPWGVSETGCYIESIIGLGILIDNFREQERRESLPYIEHCQNTRAILWLSISI